MMKIIKSFLQNFAIAVVVAMSSVPVNADVLNDAMVLFDSGDY